MKARRRSFLWGLVWLLVIYLTMARDGKALASPATFITALPVSQDQLVVRFTAIPGFSTGDPTPLGRSLSSVHFPTTFLYGATGNLALALQPEQQFGLMGENTLRGRQTRSAGGFGDTLLFARYTLVDWDWPRNTFRIAPLVGAYLPTGYYDQSDHLGRLPQNLQSGSGSADPFMGMTAAWYNPLYGFAWDATWRHNPAASSGFRLGDKARTDGQFEWRLWPWTLPTDYVPNYVWGEIETNLVWNGKDRTGGAVDDASGGFTWLLWLGLEYQNIYWEFGGEVGVPLVQSLNGTGRLTQTVAFVFFFEYYLAMPSWR